MSYGLSTKAVGAPIGAGLRSRLAQPVKYVPLSQFFTQSGDEMEKYGIIGYADREEWGMLTPKDAKRGSDPVKAEREATKDPAKMTRVKKKPAKKREEPKDAESEDGAEEPGEDEPEGKKDKSDDADTADTGADVASKSDRADDDSDGEDDKEDESGGSGSDAAADGDEEEQDKAKAKKGAGPAGKKAKAKKKDEPIDTEKNNPYLKKPFLPKEKSQEGAATPGGLLAEGKDWDLQWALDELSGPVRSWVFHSTEKGLVLDAYKGLSKKEKQALAKDVVRAVRKHHGGDSFRGYRRLKTGSEVLRGLDSVTTEFSNVQHVGPEYYREYEIKASDVLMHWGQDGPLSSKAYGHEKEVILRPGVSVSPVRLKQESGGPLLPVKTGAVRSFTGATGTGNIATAAVPIGAGDGRKFLDRPGKRKKKPRRLSGQLYILLRP